MNKTKATARIETTATVVGADRGCNGPIAWETPFLIFTLADGQCLKWHSELAEKAAIRIAGGHYAMKGKLVRIVANVRDHGLRGLRVQRMVSIEVAA